MARKLAAILSADVEGYSRLMGDDEAATVRTITEYRDAITSTVVQHGGRVVDAPGDNVLVEFSSVVDAVQCAVEIQRELRLRNADLPASRRMQFRIGINLGDVILEDARLYGDGVNIAARLEGLAEGGGICLSGTAYDQVEGKLPLQYDFLGEHLVKNIARPVRVYRLRLEPRTPSGPSLDAWRIRRRRLATVGGASPSSGSSASVDGASGAGSGRPRHLRSPCPTGRRSPCCPSRT
jgi:adenylate cyclase